MVAATQAAQPHWMTPLVTVTPRLEQEFRADFFDTNQPGHKDTLNYGGGKGLEFIPTYNTEVIIGFPPWETITQPGKKEIEGWGDWNMFLLKYRFLAENEQHGNYIVTGFFQIADPTGSNGISNNVWVAQPTIAWGQGWGDFDYQATVSQQFPIAARGPNEEKTMNNFGTPELVNVALQYHLWQYFWPEFEVNYEYWPNGVHAHLSQVLLTPGIIIGRIPLGLPGGRENLIVGVGYQFAVTDHPVVNNNWVVTARVTF